MTDTKLKLQTDEPENPVIDPNKPMPPDDPQPYPVPIQPEPIPEYPPNVIF
jgi:hypothetical protein